MNCLPDCTHHVSFTSQAYHKITSIKFIRRVALCGLKEAKDHFEHFIPFETRLPKDHDVFTYKYEFDVPLKISIEEARKEARETMGVDVAIVPIGSITGNISLNGDTATIILQKNDNSLNVTIPFSTNGIVEVLDFFQNVIA